MINPIKTTRKMMRIMNPVMSKLLEPGEGVAVSAGVDATVGLRETMFSVGLPEGSVGCTVAIGVGVGAEAVSVAAICWVAFADVV